MIMASCFDASDQKQMCGGILPISAQIKRIGGHFAALRNQDRIRENRKRTDTLSTELDSTAGSDRAVSVRFHAEDFRKGAQKMSTTLPLRGMWKIMSNIAVFHVKTA